MSHQIQMSIVMKKLYSLDETWSHVDLPPLLT